MSDTNVFLSAIQAALQSALNSAVATAVAEATRPLEERIRKLEAYEIMLTDHHDGMLAMRERITALENNPAIGVDTTLEARVKVLEERPAVTVPIDEAKMVEALNSQEWFWEKVGRVVDGKVEEALDDHCSSYDHDDYDRVVNEWGSEDVSDFVKDGDVADTVEEKLRDILNNAALSISI